MEREEGKGQATSVYVRSKDSSWFPALHLHTFNGKATIVKPIFKTEQQILQCGRRGQQKFSNQNEIIDLADYPNGVLPMQNVDANGNLEDYKDMVQLPFMHEVRHT